MNFQRFRGCIMSRTAISACAAIWAASGSPAHADSICTVDESAEIATFDCLDGSASAQGTFTGTVTPYLFPSGGIVLHSSDDLSFDLVSGEIMVTGDYERAVGLVSTGSLTYKSEGVTRTGGSNIPNTSLYGASVTANTGTVIATGGTGSVGVFSVAADGNNFTTGGTTSVTGSKSIGIRTQAINGDNITNTGAITTTGDHSMGVWAEAIAGTSCGNLTLNVTGDFVSKAWGAQATGCGPTAVHVQTGVSMTRTGTWASTLTSGSDTIATINIDGSVAALSPSDFALLTWGATTTTTISGTGFLSGFANGWTGDDTFNLHPGSVWQTAGTNRFGAGYDVINNAGTIRLEFGSADFQGLEVLSNSGVLDMAGGGVGDIVTIPGDYVALAGASLHLDANETGADRLVIAGSTTGTTSLFVNTSVLIPSPVLVVDTSGSSAGAFVLGSSSATPLIDLNLSQTGDDFFVTAVPSATALGTLQISTTAQKLWHQSIDDLWAHGILRRSNRTRDRRTPFSLWAQRAGLSGPSEFGPGGTRDRKGIQAGIDFYFADDFAFGVFGGQEGWGSNRGSETLGLETRGSNLGLFLQHIGTAGFYAGVVANANWQDVQFTNGVFAKANSAPDTRTIGLEGEAGFRIALSGVDLDLGGGLAYVRSQIEDFAVDQIGFDFGNAVSWRGRLGARADFKGKLGGFAAVKVYRELAGDELTMRSGAHRLSVEGKNARTSARLEAGFDSRGKASPAFSAWIDVGEARGLGLHADLRF